MEKIAVGVIALISFLLRVINLSTPKGFIFDEVYYVDGARDFLRYGVEVTGSKPEFVVHPPLGKWLIALGIKLFGDNEFGWRIVGAFLGTLMIILIAFIAQRLFRNPTLTILASALMAVDGLALVHARTALLDGFLAFFILVATYFFLIRRYWWSAALLGCAISVKWSGIYFLVLFALVSLYRAFTHNTGKAMIRPTLVTFFQFGFLPIAIYLTSWVGWFKSSLGWDRSHSPKPLSSLLFYHKQMLEFHTGLTEKHSYQANPWSWLIMGRPTSFFYETPQGCGAKSCSQEVLALGTPFLWWLGAIAVLVVMGFWLRTFITQRYEPALNLIILGIAAGYLPWFFFQKRTVFSFYAIAFEPFIILAIVYCAYLLLANPEKRKIAQIVIWVFFTVILLNFIYFLPLYRADILTYEAWRAHMWLPSWI